MVCGILTQIFNWQKQNRVYEEGEDDPNEDGVYDMFADLDLSQNVQDEFHFAKNYSCDEDAVLDNSGDKQENVMPLKP